MRGPSWLRCLGQNGLKLPTSTPRLDFRPLNVGRRIGTEVAGAQQLAVGVEGPAVVLAHDVARAAFTLEHERAGTVRAQVVEGAQGAVVVTTDEDGPAGEVLGDVVARVAQLMVVGDMHPVAAEDRPTLPLPDVGVVVPACGEGDVEFHFLPPYLLHPLGSGRFGLRPSHDLQLLQCHEVLQLLRHALRRAVEEQHVAPPVLGHVADGLGPHREQDQ